MKILNLVQGSPEWQAHRATSLNASEAPAMMGASSYVTRSDLLRQKALGIEPAHDERTLSRFADGHRVEALARPIAEAIIEEELFPATATEDDGPLSASFDGVTMDESVIWECKQMNEGKAAAVREGRVPDEDRWQVVQQLVVSRAERCCYMLTDGTEEGSIHCWATLDPDDEKRLRAGWAQFQRDLETYEPPEAEAPKPIGRTPDTLPALHIELKGAVTASNLNAYRDHALAVIQGINTDLQTDQDFADAESTVKFCKTVEERLDAAKQHALSQTADIDLLFRTIDEISAEARAKRLELDKLVKSRKAAIRDEILLEARRKWSDHINQINATLGKLRLPEPDVDFAGAMKGKRTVASLRDAVDTELANAKIEANARADRMRANLEILRSEAKGYETLFSDAQTLVQKDPDDLRAVIKTRINEHKQAEQARLDAERERIRAEEQVKAQREAEAKAADERRQEQERLSREAQEKAAQERSAREAAAAQEHREQVETAKPTPPPKPEAPAPEPAPTSARPHLMVELGEWQQAHGISGAAMDALIGILRDHTTALDMAA